MPARGVGHISERAEEFDLDGPVHCADLQSRIGSDAAFVSKKARAKSVFFKPVDKANRRKSRNVEDRQKKPPESEDSGVLAQPELRPYTPWPRLDGRTRIPPAKCRNQPVPIAGCGSLRTGTCMVTEPA